MIFSHHYLADSLTWQVITHNTTNKHVTAHNLSFRLGYYYTVHVCLVINNKQGLLGSTCGKGDCWVVREIQQSVTLLVLPRSLGINKTCTTEEHKSSLRLRSLKWLVIWICRFAYSQNLFLGWGCCCSHPYTHIFSRADIHWKKNPEFLVDQWNIF